MPIHDYVCVNCKHAATEYHRAAAPDIEECPKCKTPNYKKQFALIHSPQLGYQTPIEMYSIAMQTRKTMEDFKKKAPDVDLEMDDFNDPMWGIPIARTRHQKLQALKAAGFQEKN